MTMKCLLASLPWNFILAMYFIRAQCFTLRYSELQNLGASCAPMDTCSISRPVEEDNLMQARCQCRSDCVKFNTCCIDSCYVHFMPRYWGRKRGTCQTMFFSDETALVVSQCHERWRGNPDIKSLCEEISYNLKDPIGMTPVTNLRSEVTYRNYFCALCNNDVGDLEGWQVKISVYESYDAAIKQRLNEKNLLEQLRIDDYDEWGVDVQNERNETVFLRVDVKFVVQPRLASLVTPCVQNLISDCPVDWRNEDVRIKCLSYMGIVYLRADEFAPELAYRNIHCAICNNITFSSEKVCHRTIVSAFGGKPPLSFTLLLDVNLSDGDKVGEINRCEKGKMYDPFFKKCRNLVCGLPGYVIKDGRCVKA